MQSVIEILQKCEAFFIQKGVPNPKIDAQVLLAKAFKCKRLDLFLRFEDPVPENVLSEFREDVKRRAKREPLQHILGEIDFFNLKLKCDARALIPRPETEYLCEILTEKLADKKDLSLRILDLGTGSGAIILALKSFFKNSECLACDLSDKALSLALENVKLCNFSVELKKSSWFENIDGKFDLIVSNPPYLTEEEVKSAEDEVRVYDPSSALSCEENGLKDLRHILKNAKDFLKADGIVALECGLSQPKILSKEFTENYSEIELKNDLSGRERFLIAKK